MQCEVSQILKAGHVLQLPPPNKLVLVEQHELQLIEGLHLLDLWQEVDAVVREV